MSEIINKEIEQLKKEIPKLSKLSKEYLFSMICFKYFYNEGKFDSSDFVDTFVDGKGDGGIDLLSIKHSDSFQPSIVLIQSKDVATLANQQDIIDIFTKINQTINNFLTHETSRYNQRLRRIFNEKLDEVSDESPNYELVLFINLNLDDKRKKEIEKNLEKIDELKDYVKNIYYQEDIEKVITIAQEPKRYVEDDKIEIDKDNGSIKYKDNGILVNIWANSLKKIYEKHKDRGLFEQNFRYYIRNKKIDDSINHSLKKRREDFWFLNNGIIIGCEDFSIDGDNIKLHKFSIINGCQTTTLIGEYGGINEGEDFLLPCKIIKPDHKEPEEFIAQIAEASNSQKPISDRDLKSNYPEQRNLKKLLKEHKTPIYLEIKRGESKPRGLESWQSLKNDVLGQLILSFNLQYPGTARSSKKKIFADNKFYNKIFRRDHDPVNIEDLLKLYDFWNEYKKKKLGNVEALDIVHESVIANGGLVIMGIIGFIIKVKRKLIDFKLVNKDDETWENELTKDNLDGLIFVEEKNDDFDNILEGLFQKIIYEISNLYRSREAEEKTVTNFFKTDKKYRQYILKDVIQKIFDNPVELKNFETNYLQIFK